jgi:hypothetical protein
MSKEEAQNVLNSLNPFFNKTLVKSTIRRGITFEKGIYFWFADEYALRRLNIPLEPLYQIFKNTECLYLIYIGIGPKSPNTKQILKERICKCHLGNGIRQSTLRQSISALLEHNPFNSRVGKDMKIFLEPTLESEITNLINEHFSVGFIKHNEPWEIEKGFIQTYEPPINLDGNRLGWFYDTMKRKRDNHREFGKANVRCSF